MAKTFHNLSTTSSSARDYQNQRAKDNKVKAEQSGHAFPDKGRELISKIAPDMTKTVRKQKPTLQPKDVRVQGKPKVTAGQTPRGK